jgi:NADH-quinone oxidoreductase subunit C
MAQIVLDALAARFGDAIVSTSTAYGDEVATIRRERLVEVATFLRDDAAMGFDWPSFCTVIDWLGFDRPRFEMVYQLRSLSHGHRIRLKVELDDEQPSCPSLSGLWPAFNWLEREAFDMYGVAFEGHPDLRRIYMYDEFVGYPLRKDYPKDKRQPLVRRSFDE